jgi:hypothetical protein
MDDNEAARSDLQLIAALLQDDGYRAKIEPTDGAIRSAAGGLNISLYPTDNTIQLRCGVVAEDYDVQLQHVNTFNARYRFGKMYLDEDNDIVLETDHLFDVHKDNAVSTLREIMGIFEGLLNVMKRVIREAEKHVGTDSPAREPESSKHER